MPACDTPTLSVVIPTWDGHRGGCVPRLLDSVRTQRYRSFEVLLVVGVSPQGKAINLGAAAARGEVLVILDDDSRLADAHVFERLVETLAADARIGFAGASIVSPPDATPFQRRAAEQFPRFNTPVVEEITDSDFACHGCCAMPLRVFVQVGREREDIVRGLDPDLRQRLRAAGYRVVLAPQCRIYHPLPAGWGPLLRTFFRNGRGSAYAQRFQPDTVYDTSEQLADAGFHARRSLPYRIVRFPLRLLHALATARWMRLAAYTSYACGYIWAWCTARRLGDGA